MSFITHARVGTFIVFVMGFVWAILAVNGVYWWNLSIQSEGVFPWQGERHLSLGHLHIHTSSLFGYVLHDGETLLRLFSHHDHRVQNIINTLVTVLCAVVAFMAAVRAFKGINPKRSCMCIALSCLLFLSPLRQVLEYGVSSLPLEVLRLLVVFAALLALVKGWLPERSGLQPGIEAIGKPVLLAFASQTGSAKRLAASLHQSVSEHMEVRCCSSLSVDDLQAYSRLLFIVSTQGDGHAPDSAAKFVSTLKSHIPKEKEPDPITFSVLALGDRSYRTFCAFGHTLTDLLESIGYRKEIPTHEVDRMDMSTVHTWWHQALDYLGLEPTHLEDARSSFQVVFNRCLNPGSQHRPAHHIRLAFEQGEYLPGDLLSVEPKTLSGRTQPRLYSIASYAPGSIDLLVRLHHRADGSKGVASQYLCELSEGDTIKATLQEHPSFRPVDDAPMIMIGAGTGIAPFKSFLEYQQANNTRSSHWLIFGEQYQEHDFYFSDNIHAFQRSGLIAKLDIAWSRSQGRYVQDVIEAEREEIRRWVYQEKAHIFVCGNRLGFGESVLDALRDLFEPKILDEHLHADLY